ncbi:Uncharacterised protein [Mycobacteroides abscessus subsp. abscessus]|nr:Uncharacterised protein [Mycobacteroides abscessus subsp. abscessus]
MVTFEGPQSVTHDNCCRGQGPDESQVARGVSLERLADLRAGLLHDLQLGVALARGHHERSKGHDQ